MARPRIIQEETREEAKEMLKEGLAKTSAARYLGISNSALYYITSERYRKSHDESQKRYNARNREKILRRMREYYVKNKT